MLYALEYLWHLMRSLKIWDIDWAILFRAGLRPATLLKKILRHRCFPVNFAKFLRTSFFTEQFRWMLLPFAFFINYLLWSCSASRNAVKVFFKGVLVKRIQHSSKWRLILTKLYLNQLYLKLSCVIAKCEGCFLIRLIKKM